jgi:peptidoglycan/LPS O-acetylase OafA/YrhL
MSISAQRLDYMNVARGCAILMIIFVHTAQAVSGLSSFASMLAQYGQFGVQLFFMVSAYTLCLSTESRAQESKPVFFFYIRRFFRIAPLYYFAILVYFLFFAFKKFYLEGNVYSFDPYSIGNVLANVFFIHGFVPSANNNIVPGGWSIGTEIAFYLIFPFLFAFLKRGNMPRVKKVIIAIIVAFVFNLLFQLLANKYSSIGLDSSDFLYFNIINQISVFLFGILIHFLSNDAKKWEARIPVSYLVVLASGFSLLVLYILNSSMPLARAMTSTIFGLSCFFFMLHLKKINAGNIFFSRIGICSFSMYIFHFIFAWGAVPQIAKSLNKMISPDVTLIFCFVIVVGLTYLIALVTEKHIEERGISFGKHLIDVKSRKSGTKIV